MLCVALAVAACGAPAAEPAPRATAPPPDYYDSFAPLPASYETADRPLTDARVALGRMLFFEPRLSASGTLSCASCHDLARYGVDNLPVAIGHDGQTGTRNAPTVYNAAGYLAQFWDGRSPDVEDQARHPILNPVEMAAPDEAWVVAALRTIPGYREPFARAFPGEAEPITYANMVTAIGAFERRLVTPSRFDRFLGGDEAALSPVEAHGFRRFVELGCAGCHNGPELGGHTFEKLGHLLEYPDQRDPGRFEVTRRPEDRMRFRVPGLRNVAMTAPYFHDGSVATLGEAVTLMARHQLRLDLGHDDLRSLVAFLQALTGELPAASLIEPPVLPGAEPVRRNR